MNNYDQQLVRCACVVGTRPEVIKMAPVIRRLFQSDWAMPFVVATGQQDDLLERALNDFRIVPDHAIPYDARGASIAPALVSIVGKLDEVFARIKPAFVIGQGDTTSVFAASVAAFYRSIPFVHVESGLRTGDLSAPFPEEFHRRAIAVSTLWQEAGRGHECSRSIPLDILAAMTVAAISGWCRRSLMPGGLRSDMAIDGLRPGHLGERGDRF